MRPYDLARLVGLATIWSLQFLFLRVAVPVFGTTATADGRAFLGAAVLIPAALIAGQRFALQRDWRAYLLVSVFNNVLPFVLYALAAIALPAGYLSIINGTVPLWTALFAAWALGERFGPGRVAGFAIGFAGVAMLVRLGPIALEARTLLATLAGLGATACWAWAGILIKQRTGRIDAIAFAGATTLLSALILSPAWVGAPPPSSWTAQGSAALLLLGAGCSGLAYLALFTLLRDIGPSRTLSVGFLTPPLGVLWGWLFLGEPVTASMIGGGVLVVLAMALVLRR